jgi:hypothetical protein
MNGSDILRIADEQFVDAKFPKVARSCDGSLRYFGDGIVIATKRRR